MTIVTRALTGYIQGLGYPNVLNDWLPELPDQLVSVIQPTGDQPHLNLSDYPSSASEVGIQVWVRSAPKDYDGAFFLAEKLHSQLADLVDVPLTVDYLAQAQVVYDLALTMRTMNGPAVLERDPKERVVFLSTYAATAVWNRRVA